MIDLNILKANYHYFTGRLPTWPGSDYRFDERAMNLLWLVHPEIETHIKDPNWEGDMISHAVQDLALWPMGLREALTLMPVDFMRAFRPTDDLVRDWPEDYMERMWERAHKAQGRIIDKLIGGKAGPNVAVVDFRSKRRVA